MRQHQPTIRPQSRANTYKNTIHPYRTPPIPSPAHAGGDGLLSHQRREELAGFLASSVLPKTNRVYEGHWVQWTQFLKSEVDEDDSYLGSKSRDGKSELVCRMMQRRRQAGHRGKGVTDFTEGIRQFFSCRMLPTDFLDATAVGSARVSCLTKPDELRRRRDSDEGCSVKLPICCSVLVEMKTRRWAGLRWSDAEFRLSVLYLGCMFAFKLASRIGEYTKKENNGSDHCCRLDDLTFAVETGSGSSNVAGSALADLPFVKARRGYGQIAECRVFGVSSKGKITTTAHRT
jgi:hypothetical protein